MAVGGPAVGYGGVGRGEACERARVHVGGCTPVQAQAFTGEGRVSAESN